MIRYPLTAATRRAACALTLLAASPCFASLQPAKDAPVAVKTTETCRVHADLSEDCTYKMHMDILTSAGRDTFSQLDVPAPPSHTLSDIEAYIIKRDGTRRRLPDSHIVKKSGTSSEKYIDNSTTTIFLFEGIEVGDAIEYSFKEHNKATKEIATFQRNVTFAPEAVRYDSFHLEYVADRPIILRGEELDAFKVKSSEDGKKITIDLAQPRYFAIENEDAFIVRKLPRIELAFSDKLDDHYGKVVGLYNEILSAPLPPGAAMEVERLKNKPQQEQIRSLIRFLADNYRYLADYRLDNRGRIPFDLAETEKNGYGDCKDLTVLLTAMIRSLGMDAEPAFVKQGDYAPNLLIPGLQAADHVIVRATVDGKTWWIDATIPVLLPGYTPDNLQDRWAVVLGKDGKPRLDTIPLAEARMENSTTQETQFRPDGTSDINTNTLFNGAPLLRLMAKEHDEGANAVDQAFCDGNEGCIVTRPAMDKVTPPYQVKIHLPEQSAGSKHEGKYSMSPGDYFGFALNELKSYRATGGIGDLNVGGPTISEVSTRISGIKLSRAPSACHVRSRWGDYDAEFRQEANGVVAYKLRASEKVAWIPHDDLMSDEFGKFLKQAEACYEGLTFSYTTEPSGK
ncbi:transglutaminase domain-containing protein [Dyella sp. LX-66]|uniref:DUF3857 domain-containing protein n=1 Tax=unclassified Dyella TaxID=2634549 RepID=UPI001BDF8A0B|nr:MULTISPECIES: DUF3857 domain-containing protein [unclassified Dyella]MBT2115469.1 transglutaminase domain-containing protein [Dyella sp. LX-1]MBT2139284.1 transglutaminase domain-containing protein [Dyella sp. LX-66]